MKFAALALIAGASALKLKSHAAIKAKAQLTNKSLLAVALKAKDEEDWECPTPEEKEEAQPAVDWAVAELERDGDITMDEIKDALKDAGIKLSKKEWKMVKEGFAYLDTNDDHKIDVAEAEAAHAAFVAECGEW